MAKVHKNIQYKNIQCTDKLLRKNTMYRLIIEKKNNSMYRLINERKSFLIVLDYRVVISARNVANVSCYWV